MSDWVLSIAGAGEFPILGSSVSLGRDGSCDLALGQSHPSVSRRHAQLEPHAEGVWVTDLGSSNGTRINGIPVTTRALAANGDTIEFGTVRSILRLSGAGHSMSAPPIDSTIVAPMPPFHASPPVHPPPPVYAPPPVQHQPPPSPYPPPAAFPAPVEKGSDVISVIGMTMAIVSACLTLVALLPCLGWLNWITIAGGGTAHILNWIAFAVEGRNPVARNRAIIGLVVTAASLTVGVVRLVLGAGCF